ncbi:MAG TPA: CDP-alcohol phosphatidyltransferase family protein [Candidatus Acidoferrales bacterium]|nr:CDP-alcohol phosphatidyltransferase family protein [Candidatus Acidoferrales bacterium]
MYQRFFTVPNQVTFLRLAFLPLFLALVFYDHYRWALAVLVIAGCSDGLDGLLARRLNQRTALGAYLDPIADKLLLSSSFLVLALKGKIRWWLTFLVLGRDVTMLTIAVVIILVVGYRPFPPTIYGKITTTVQLLLVFEVLTRASFPQIGLEPLQTVLKYSVAGFTVFSGFHYSVIIARRLSSVGEPKLTGSDKTPSS